MNVPTQDLLNNVRDMLAVLNMEQGTAEAPVASFVSAALPDQMSNADVVATLRGAADWLEEATTLPGS